MVTAKKATKKKVSKKTKADAPIGFVTHYYGGIGVAIVKFSRPFKVGGTLNFRGATTNFHEMVHSMQYDHKDIASAVKGKEVGIKVSERVREGDAVYLG